MYMIHNVPTDLSADIPTTLVQHQGHISTPLYLKTLLLGLLPL